VGIELSVTFAPERGEAVREAADEAGLSLSEWLAQAAEGKLNADRDAAILAEAERERRRRGLREFLDEYQAEYGAFTEEEMAEASRKLGLSWPPEEDTDERARA
jgi:hypothetical protein